MTRIHVEGMKCGHCAGSVTKALEALDGISQVQVDLETKQVTFEGEADEAVVRKAIEDKGFHVVSA